MSDSRRRSWTYRIPPLRRPSCAVWRTADFGKCRAHERLIRHFRFAVLLRSKKRPRESRPLPRPGIRHSPPHPGLCDTWVRSAVCLPAMAWKKRRCVFAAATLYAKTRKSDPHLHTPPIIHQSPVILAHFRRDCKPPHAPAFGKVSVKVLPWPGSLWSSTWAPR